MAGYHINQKTGNANICRAKEGNCPLKDVDGDYAPHFETKLEAEAFYEKQRKEDANKGISGISAEKRRSAQSVFEDSLVNLPFYDNDNLYLIKEHIKKFVSSSGQGEWNTEESDINKFLIDDAMAKDIRKKLNVDDNEPVYLLTEINYGGYSEYTQENDFSCAIVCKGHYKEFLDSGYGSYSIDKNASAGPFGKLLNWLTD